MHRLENSWILAGLRDLIDFLPATLGTIVTYFAAEITRGIWKPVPMNGTDWPSPAAILSAVDSEIKEILAAAGVDFPCGSSGTFQQQMLWFIYTDLLLHDKFLMHFMSAVHQQFFFFVKGYHLVRIFADLWEGCYPAFNLFARSDYALMIQLCSLVKTLHPIYIQGPKISTSPGIHLLLHVFVCRNNFLMIKQVLLVWSPYLL